MTTEELLLNKWRELSPAKQEEVLDFVNFLSSRATDREDILPQPETIPLGQKLREIRAKIISSGVSLLQTWEEVEQEIAERRGGIEDRNE
jgi:hypothetical protein